MPEVDIRAVTWTRESHGLFDFEQKESERRLYLKKQYKRVKGTYHFLRDESDLTIEAVDQDKNYQTFEQVEEVMCSEKRESIIARMLYQDGAYWLFHKNLIDEDAEQVLEKKPEEKIWRVVKEIRDADMERPCYRL